MSSLAVVSCCCVDCVLREGGEVLPHFEVEEKVLGRGTVVVVSTVDQENIKCCTSKMIHTLIFNRGQRIYLY